MTVLTTEVAIFKAPAEGIPQLFESLDDWQLSLVGGGIGDVLVG